MPVRESYLQEVIPKFTINKIFVDNRKVSFKCSLKRPASFDFSSWNGIAGINLIKYLDFHIVLLQGDPGIFSRNIYYAQNRVNFLTQNRARLVDWEMTLKGPSYGLNGHTKINMLELLQGDSATRDPLTAGEIPHIIGTDNHLSHNMSFDVTVDCRQDIFDPSRPEASNAPLHAFAFCQLDIKSLSEDFMMHEFVGSLTKIGGPLVYEPVLIKEDSRLVAPKTRSVFTLSSGEYYSGPTHYHSPASPGPSGYIGWMTGPFGHDMSDRSQLTMRTVRNTKVSSNFFIERSISFEFDGYTSSQSGFFGNESRSASPYGNLTLGPDLLSNLLSDTGISLLADPRARYAKISKLDNRVLKELVINSQKNQNPNLFDCSVDPEDLFSIVPGGDAGRGHYLSVFLLNFEQLIRSNSKFGYLLDFHREEVNNPTGVANQALSQQFIDQVLGYSFIWQMKAHRKRITNDAVGNNRATTSAFENYDTDQVEKYLTSLNLDNQYTGESQLYQIDDVASLEIIDDRINSPHGVKKSFSLKDYDLFSSHSFGKFEYSMEIEAEDGIRLYLILLHDDLRAHIDKFSNLIKEASQPYLDPAHSGYFIGNQFSDPNTEVEAQGNYNFHLNDFTPEYKAATSPGGRRIEFFNVVRYLSELYNMVVYTLTKKGASRPIEDFTHALMPATGTLDNMTFFLNLCLRLQERFREMIFEKDADENMTGIFGETTLARHRSLSLGSAKKNVSKNSEYPNRYIRIKSRTNSRVDASSKFKVLFEASPPLNPDILNNIGRGSIQLLPDSTVRIPSEFFILSADQIVSEPGLIDLFPGAPLPPPTFNRRHIAGIDLNDPAGSAVAASKVAAAVEAVKTGTGHYQSRPGEISLREFDELLYNSGATFGSVLSKVTNISQSDAAESKLKGEVLDADLQTSVFNSIITAKDGKEFENQMEEKFKDMFLTKKAMGSLYKAVMFTMTSGKLNSRARNKTTYRDRVTSSNSSQEKSAKNTRNYKSNHAGVGTVVTEHRYDGTSGLDGTSKRSDSSTSIIIKKVTTDSTGGAQLVNSIVIDKQADNDHTEVSGRPGQIKSSIGSRLGGYTR